jgi:tetratricopeptide (TPR) repeat protein
VRWRVFPVFLLTAFSGLAAHSNTVVVIEFQNKSQYSDLNWVGESIADRLMTEFAANGQIVPTRAERQEAERRLSLRPGADYTKATLVHIGQTLDADVLCFGNFTISLASPEAQLKDSSIRIAAQFLDLRKMHFGPEISEAGQLSELSRLEGHLAFESLRYLQPDANLKLDHFVSAQKTVHLEAEESYTRGLLSSDKEQRQRWFLQAAAVDSKFPGPVFELGKLALEQRQYPQALDWFRRIVPDDPNYADARFKMGLAAYNSGDYVNAGNYFREVAQTYPLSEVYNNLGAAEAQIDPAAGIVDLRRALESDPHANTYLFNLGWALIKAVQYEEASRVLQQILTHSDDPEAQLLNDHARRRTAFGPEDKLPALRLKSSFNGTAFRQLKAMVQTKQ